MAKDTMAKNEFVDYIKKVFRVGDEQIKKTDKTTDIIFMRGENKSDWLYFELKTTTEDNSKNKKKYFGAASLSQWVEASRHPNHYYFVLAYRKHEGEKYSFCFVTPDILKTYITGCYMNIDFNVPYDSLQKYGLSEDKIELQLEEICQANGYCTIKGSNSPKEDKIKDLDNYIEAKISNYGTH